MQRFICILPGDASNGDGGNTSSEAVSQIQFDFKTIFAGEKSLHHAESTLTAAVTQIKAIAEATHKDHLNLIAREAKFAEKMSEREEKFKIKRKKLNSEAVKLRAQRSEFEERQALLDIKESDIEDRETDLEIKLTVADDMAVDVGEATGLAENLHID
jgi:hypothetical protein